MQRRIRAGEVTADMVETRSPGNVENQWRAARAAGTGRWFDNTREFASNASLVRECPVSARIGPYRPVSGVGGGPVRIAPGGGEGPGSRCRGSACQAW